MDELIVVEKFIEDPVAHLQIMCASRGVSLSEICKRADVDRSTVERWKEKNPTTLAIISRLQNALKEIPTI